MKVLFITGSTGFIGKEVLKQLTNGAEKLLLLVRSLEKAQDMLNKLGLKDDRRISLLKGSLKEPSLGLSHTDYQRALETDVIIHAGGTMSVTLDKEIAKQTFLDGSRYLAELAERIHRAKGLDHFIHVVGYMSPNNDDNIDMKANVFDFDSFMKGESEYERMKFLADLYIRQQAKLHGYPLSVVNPSTVIGASPAGVTEQVGGLGVLVDAVRRNLMPVVPGGSSHWVPFVANDNLARIIIFLARKLKPIQSRTYNILGDKSNEPNMQELITTISHQLSLPAPGLSVPVPILRAVMKAGVGRLTGIPAESMSFVTNRSFQNKETKQLLKQMGHESLDIKGVLPQVIADLDYRLTHPNYVEPENFVRERKGNLAALVREGSGIPWVIVHGLLSSADDFVLLAEQIHKRTVNPVWLLDLPGFGRSPVMQENKVFSGYVDALCKAIEAAPSRIRLVGHSFGAVIAAKAAQAMPQSIEQLYLLQPVLHHPQNNTLRHRLSASIKVAKLLLRRISVGGYTRTMLREGVFAELNEIPDGYVKALKRSLSSPRIAAANAAMLHVLEHGLPLLEPNELFSANTSIIWGTKDKAYVLPKAFQQMNPQFISYGHQFPVSYPEKTAELLERLIIDLERVTTNQVT
jgi:nucleoside-diphosphate-sugar epimerase/pimeloyl-ACP methyl ester carboxylesterase